jgi:hypothetical protein
MLRIGGGSRRVGAGPTLENLLGEQQVIRFRRDGEQYDVIVRL